MTPEERANHARAMAQMLANGDALAPRSTAGKIAALLPPGSLILTPDETLAEIRSERARQDAKWGGVPGVDRRDDHTYAAVLGEEFGEACRAWIERDVAALRAELIQVAAVAVAWIEEIDNGGAEPRLDIPGLIEVARTALGGVS